jgi:hypothetical protein
MFGGVFAARSSDSSAVTQQNIISNTCAIVHDNTTTGHFTWCRYAQSVITASAVASHHIGDENSLVNQGTAVAEDPFNTNPTASSVNLRLDCGNGALSGNDCGAALDIVPNTQKFISGINIANNALDPSLNANPPAIQLPNSYAVTWYSAAGSVGARVYNGTDGLLHAFSTGALQPEGGMASVGSCTGLGPGGTCALASGSNNNVGQIILTTGTGPNATGNVTITFSTSIGPNLSQCTFTPQNAGAGWRAPVTILGLTISASSYQFSWTNSVALTANQTYNIGYICFGY